MILCYVYTLYAHNKGVYVSLIRSPVCQKSWKVALTTHGKLLQHMVRPRCKLLFAELALKVLCSQVVPAVYIKHFPYCSVQTCLSKIDDLSAFFFLFCLALIIAGQFDPPDFLWCPKEERQ